MATACAELLGGGVEFELHGVLGKTSFLFSHINLSMTVHSVTVRTPPPLATGKWLEAQSLRGYPLPTAMKRVVDVIFKTASKRVPRVAPAVKRRTPTSVEGPKDDAGANKKQKSVTDFFRENQSK